MVTEINVRTVLDEIIHPSFGMSIVALDMVRVIRVSDNLIEVDLVMNCPGCPAGETVLALARRKIEALQSGTVRLNLLPTVWTPPWEQSS